MQRRKAERPTEILAAAFEEFICNGYATTRLEDVAARAGVTKATIYFHFQSKENVFTQMIRELSKPYRARVQKFMDDRPRDGIAFLTEFLSFSYAQIISDRHTREILRLMLAESNRFPDLIDEYAQETFEPVLNELQNALRADAKAGIIRDAGALDFPELMTSPMLALNVILLLFANRRQVDVDMHLAAAKDLLLNGLLPRG